MTTSSNFVYLLYRRSYKILMLFINDEYMFLFVSAVYYQPNICPNSTWKAEKTWEAFCQCPIKLQPNAIFVDIYNRVYTCCCEIWLEWTRWYFYGPYYVSRSAPYMRKPRRFSRSIGGISRRKKGGNGIDIQLPNGQIRRLPLKSNRPCYGLFVDDYNRIYCSLRNHHVIIRKSLKDGRAVPWKVVAGSGKVGITLDDLNEPLGIFVNTNYDLYVADCKNHRIQLFRRGQQAGKAIFKDIEISSLKLNCPTDVILDGHNNLYIADSGNKRIVFVTSDFTSGRCLIDCSGKSNSDSTGLNQQMSINFDWNGNLYVSDTENKRVKQFTLQTEDCVENLTYNIPVTYGTPLGTFPTDHSNSNESYDRDDIYRNYTYYEIPEEVEIVTSDVAFESSTMLTGTDNNKPTSETTLLSSEPSVSSLITTVTTTSSSSTSSPSSVIDQTPPPTFVPPNCSNASSIGSFCNASNLPCEIQNPCGKSGNCTNDATLPQGYSCQCKTGFSGTNCEVDTRPCRLHACLHNGVCIEKNNTHALCNCTKGRIGIHCEILINYCNNVTCLNNGICRPLPLDYKCECISSSFSGRHCEDVATSLVVRQYVSKSFAYIAIISLSLVVGFVITMDILKYGFGIDPVREERELIRRQRLLREKTNCIAKQSQNALHLRRIN